MLKYKITGFASVNIFFLEKIINQIIPEMIKENDFRFFFIYQKALETAVPCESFNIFE